MRITVGQREDRNTISAKVLSRLTEFLGGTEQSRDSYTGGSVYMQWGFKLTAGLQYALDNKLPYIIIDWGYFSPREKSISISFNGFHGLSMSVSAVADKPARWHPLPRPWRTTPGEFVYVYGQLQNDRATRGLHVEAWLRRTAMEAGTAFGVPAKIRPHPKTISSWERPLPSLESTFEETHAAVVWTSSAAIESVLAGIPTVALHPACPAIPAAARNYVLYMPDRTEWLHDLSWRNYRLKDLGEAAKYIRMGLDEAVAMAEAGAVDTEGLRV